MDRVRNVDLRGKLKQEGVLDTVKKRQQNWKQRVEEMSNNKVLRSMMERFQEDTPEEDPGRDRAVTLINSILNNSHIQNKGIYRLIAIVLSVVCNLGDLPHGRLNAH